MKKLLLKDAPRDCTLLWLLVDYSGEDAAHPLEDAVQAWTIGWNNFDNDGEDRWSFAGWCWSHDHWTEGRGEVIGWHPVETEELQGRALTFAVLAAGDDGDSG